MANGLALSVDTFVACAADDDDSLVAFVSFVSRDVRWCLAPPSSRCDC